MVNVASSIKEMYSKLDTKYNASDKDMTVLVTEMEPIEYVMYLCYKMYKWLEVDKIKKVCIYYSEVTKFMTSTNITMGDLDDACQVVITAAKYYVRGGYAVQRAYNL